VSARLRLDGGATLELDDDALDAVAERVAEILVEREAGRPEPWVGVEEAAEHLACPPSRVYALTSACRIPHERDGSRLLFRRSQLDLFIAEGGAKRP